MLKISKVRQLQIDVSPSIFGVGQAIDAWGGSLLLGENDFDGLRGPARRLCTLNPKGTFFFGFFSISGKNRFNDQ